MSKTIYPVGFALVLWGGRLEGQAPRTALFELGYHYGATKHTRNDVMRKAGCKRWKPRDNETILNVWPHRPTKVELKQARLIAKQTWLENAILDGKFV